MRTVDTPEQFAACYDLVVAGAGPAGMAAAARAAQLGLQVLLVDENPAPGGQIYRAIGSTPVADRALLGADYWRGADAVARLARAPLDYAARCTLWAITPDAVQDMAADTAVDTASPVNPSPHQPPAAPVFELSLSLDGCARLIGARQIILATGAQERPLPIPGWTLPGVMGAGAAQIALKSAALVPAGRTVLAGCGPLLYLLAAQLSAAGADIVALLDTTARANWRQAAAALPDFLRSPYAAKGIALLARARRMRRIAGVTALAAQAQGDGPAQRLAAVRFERGGQAQTLACDTLLLHQGVIPSVNLASAAGCALEFDATQHCWSPRVDGWCASTVPAIAVAGDGAGITGAEGAALRGELAALAAAHSLGRITQAARDGAAAPLRTALRRWLRGRRFLDLLYRPAPQFLAPPQPDTIVCRCEEVTAGQVRETAARLGVTGPNQMKAFLRCGMGPCQGRMCGPTVVELIAQTHGLSPAQVGYYRLRPPVKPVTLAELAALPHSAAAAAVTTNVKYSHELSSTSSCRICPTSAHSAIPARMN